MFSSYESGLAKVDKWKPGLLIDVPHQPLLIVDNITEIEDRPILRHLAMDDQGDMKYYFRGHKKSKTSGRNVNKTSLYEVNLSQIKTPPIGGMMHGLPPR